MDHKSAGVDALGRGREVSTYTYNTYKHSLMAGVARGGRLGISTSTGMVSSGCDTVTRQLCELLSVLEARKTMSGGLVVAGPI